ncbi:hypothetical protein A6A27_26600 [Micromonospora sp. CB01531]|nr:hypothetical protein A6A27_26600 [Micromonospora sp. CB01531]
MYAAYPNPARFDEHLHSQITIWETDQTGPPIGLAELAALRERRRSGVEPSRATLSVENLLIDRWGDTAAVARYVLRATTPAGDTTFRVSDVWDAAEGSWQIVHHHAELVATPAARAVVGDPH